MSFLNPVNEPVLRFSSTDADAPQIDYNARVAGDVKTILKACLVTGYGDKASAGWSIVNEVDHVAEFVSPSVAMSDYRLGIDDRSASSTTWYYQYQDVRVNPIYSNPTKSFRYADKSHVDNGWQLLVTERGMIFVELVQHTVAAKLSTRITYIGQMKSAISGDVENMLFFNIGHDATIENNQIYSRSYIQPVLGTQLDTSLIAITSSTRDNTFDLKTISLTSRIFVDSAQGILATVAGIYSQDVAQESEIYGVRERKIDSFTVLDVTAGYSYSSEVGVYNRGRVFSLNLDYWEY